MGIFLIKNLRKRHYWRAFTDKNTSLLKDGAHRSATPVLVFGHFRECEICRHAIDRADTCAARLHGRIGVNAGVNAARQYDHQH